MALRDGIKGCWRLSGGVWDDLSGNGNTLLAFGTPSQVNGFNGGVNTAVGFDGIDQSLYISDASQVGLDITVNITIAFWIKLTSNSIVTWPVNKSYTDGQRAYEVFVWTNGSVFWKLYSNGTTATQMGSSGVLTQGQWYHIACVYDGSYMRMYKNGAAVGTPVAYSSGIFNGTDEFGVGAYNHSGGRLDGSMDDVCIWNRALSADEVSELYATGEDFAGLFTVNMTDTGVGSDALTISAILSLLDNGGGIDAVVVDDGTVKITVTDTATGTDTPQKAAVYISITDSGSGAEAGSLALKMLTISDSGSGNEIISLISNNSLHFGVVGFPGGRTVEYRIKDQNGVVIQDWTFTGVTEDAENADISTYTVKNIMLENGFQGKISWRIPGTRYIATEMVNYYESWISTYASLPTLSEIEGSTVLAKEATLSRLLGLALENHVEDDVVRDASGNKTSSVLCCYNSAGSVGTHVSGGGPGLVAKYNVTATYSSGKMTSFKVVKA